MDTTTVFPCGGIDFLPGTKLELTYHANEGGRLCGRQVSARKRNGCVS